MWPVRTNQEAWDLVGEVSCLVEGNGEKGRGEESYLDENDSVGVVWVEPVLNVRFELAYSVIVL